MLTRFLHLLFGKGRAQPRPQPESRTILWTVNGELRVLELVGVDDV